MDESTELTTKKPICKYGEKCYRKSEAHLNEYDHAVKPRQQKRDREPVSTDLHKENGAAKELRLSAPADNPGAAAESSERLNDDSRPKQKTVPATIKDYFSSGRQEKRHSLPVKPENHDCCQFIKEKFLVDMPPDFYSLWDVAVKVNSNPKEAFNCGQECPLELCGPFDVLAGLFDSEHSTKLEPEDYLVHCRFALDPPEFQTVLLGHNEHYGYLRDDPSELPSVVCSNSNSTKGFHSLEIEGDNLFAVVCRQLNQVASGDSVKKAETLVAQLKRVAEKEGFSLEKKSEKVRERAKKVVAKTLHGAGIVVPMNDDVGYRPLSETNATLKKTVSTISETADEDRRNKKMESIIEMITYVQFANDECDYGMGLELGLDLFASGYLGFHPQIRQLLSVAYSLLDREPFTTILEAHLNRRDRDFREITEGFINKSKSGL